MVDTGYWTDVDGTVIPNDIPEFQREDENPNATWTGTGSIDEDGNWTAAKQPITLGDPAETEGSVLGQNVANETGANLAVSGTAASSGYDESLDEEGNVTTGAGSAKDIIMNAGVASGLSDEDGKGGFVDDRSTVSGQLKSLLSEDSDYITQARLSGERQAAGRGMLNSSMAAGASQAEAIKAAQPIAAQDAQTHATAQSLEQQSLNKQSEIQAEAIVSGGLSEQNAKIAASVQNVQNTFSAALQNSSEENQVLLQDMLDINDKFAASFDADFQIMLQNEELIASQKENIVKEVSTIMQNYAISIENMLTDPDFLDLGTDAMNNALEVLQIIAANAAKGVGAMGGVNMDEIVEQYIYNDENVEGTPAKLDTEIDWSTETEDTEEETVTEDET